ncbi:MAG: hypothetical protein GEV09_27420 [Pseudonocardiaceae bacterium]|nr:hypothetical protein [Pseudonocardiaceae bacterium]
MVHVLNPVGQIERFEVARPSYPTDLQGVRVNALENTKHNAGALLAHLLERLGGAGAIVGALHRKDFSSVPADPEIIDALSVQADLVLVGTAD